jgi:hypothetical protein
METMTQLDLFADTTETVEVIAPPARPTPAEIFAASMETARRGPSLSSMTDAERDTWYTDVMTNRLHRLAYALEGNGDLVEAAQDVAYWATIIAAREMEDGTIAHRLTRDAGHVLTMARSPRVGDRVDLVWGNEDMDA